MKPNIGQLVETVELASRLGINEIYLEQLYGPFPDLILDDLAPWLDVYREARHQAHERQVTLLGPMIARLEERLAVDERVRMGLAANDDEARAMDVPLPGRPPHLPAARCPEPWQTIFVERTGNVIPCCFQQSCSALGRIPENSPDGVWQGEGYRALRRGVVEEPYFPGCEACIAAKLPPSPIISAEWLNSVELGPPGTEDVEIPPTPAPPPRGLPRIARAIRRRLAGLGGGGT
jgi:hypothetical protein